MNVIKHILILISTLLCVDLYAHKDRVENALEYKIIRNFSDTITVKEISDSIQTIIDRSEWTQIQVKFSTNETVIFDYVATRLTGIKINYDKRDVIVPLNTLVKLSNIKFSTISLFWDGRDEKAFKAGYFYLEFEMGKDKLYGEYPKAHLFFKKRKFKSALMLVRVSEKKRARIHI